MYYVISYEQGGEITTHRECFPSRRKAEAFRRMLKEKLGRKKCKVVFRAYPLRY